MGVKSGRTARASIARRFDGWQPGLLAVLVAWATALLVVPRPVAPWDVPEPPVPPAAIAALRAREGALAERARASLSAPVRALGSAVRAVGAAEVARDGRRAGAARQQVAAAIGALPDASLEEVLALRAYQTEAFVVAVRAWQESGARSADLDELGGTLTDAIARACEDGGRQVTMDDDELGAAFRKRWAEIVSAREGALRPTLLEERMLFVHALRHPRLERTADGRTAAAIAATALLRRVEQHGRLDPDYPVDFARGVALYRAGQFTRALQAFDRHLRLHPEGPLAARAHNHARAAVDAELGDPPPTRWLAF